MLKRRLAALAVVVGAVGIMAGSASAVSGTVNATPTSGLSNGDLVTINWNGWNPNDLMFFQECNTNSATLDITQDCSPLSLLTAQSDGNGAGTFDSFQVYVGKLLDRGLPWQCLPEGQTAPPGFTTFHTCYIRVTQTTGDNLGDQKFIPITFATTTPPVPEAPYAIFLPLGALAVLAGGYVIVRNRKRTPSAA
jgi:hypothetical protein